MQTCAMGLHNWMLSDCSARHIFELVLVLVLMLMLMRRRRLLLLLLLLRRG